MNKLKQILSTIIWTPILVVSLSYLPTNWVQANILQADNQAYCENVYMRLWIDKEAIDYPECDFKSIWEQIKGVKLLNNRN